MMIMLHIIIATGSLLVSVLGLALASRALVRGSYGLIVATVATGSVLLIMNPSTMLRVCVSGLIYVAIATSLTYAAHQRIRTVSRANNR